jgi:eukaryotic-like serine/threonine-protein kinase
MTKAGTEAPESFSDMDLSGFFGVEPQPPLSSVELPATLFVGKPGVPAASAVHARASTRTMPEPQRAPAAIPMRGEHVPRAFEIEPTLPRPGSVIEKYRLESVIGIGGFAVVYHARHLLLDTDVALKLLRPSVVQRRPRLPSLLCEEARYAARIEHVNVVRMLDVTHSSEVTYLVMELIEGPDLAVMLRRRRRLPTKMVLRILSHVVAGLEAGRRENLIHRDIKPSNILLTRTGITKIVDFGLARSASAAASSQVVGTVGYMSPEQTDRPTMVDFRSDMYSLGVTVYQALLGSVPFPTDDPAHCAEMHRTQPVVPPGSVDRAIPNIVSDLVMWLLEKDPRARPASYDDLRAAVDQCLRRL